MSDYEKLKKIFTEFEIEFKINRKNAKNRIISIEQGMKRVGGYIGFGARFIFDKNEKFIEVSIIEE